jgi:hypothetical protein
MPPPVPTSQSGNRSNRHFTSPGFGGKKASSHASQIFGTNVTAKIRANEPSATLVQAAWEALGPMSPDDAKKEFLVHLCTVAPYWKYEHFI